MSTRRRAFRTAAGTGAVTSWSFVLVWVVRLPRGANPPWPDVTFLAVHGTALAVASVCSTAWWLSRPIATVNEAYELGYTAGRRDAILEANNSRRIIELREPSRDPAT